MSEQTAQRGWLRMPAFNFLRYGAVAFPLIFILILSRRPDLLTNAQLWAEDGMVFLNLGIGQSFRTLLGTHGGYFHFVPFFVSSFFDTYNFYYAPLVFNLVALGVMTVPLWLFLSDAFEEVLPWRWRLLAVAAICLLPWYSETYGNLTHVQRYLFLSMALLSLGDLNRIGRPGRVCLFGFAFLAAFTAPTLILLTPVLAYQVLTRLRRRDYIFFFSAFTLVLVIASAVLARLAEPGATPELSWEVLSHLPAFLGRWIGFKLVGLSLLGQKLTGDHLQGAANYLPLTFAFILFLAVYFFLVCKRSALRVTNLALVYYTLAPIVFAFLARPEWSIDSVIIRDDYWGESRYLVVPSAFLAILVLDFARRLAGGSRLIKLLLLIPLFFYAQAVWTNFGYSRQIDLEWRSQVRGYYEALIKAEPGEKEGHYHIPIPPGERWRLGLPIRPQTPEGREKAERMVERLK